MTDPNERSLSENTAEAPSPTASEAAEDTSPQRAGDSSLWRPSYLFLSIVTGIVVALDLGTKHWALARLETNGLPTPMEIVQGKLAFVLARNRGGAWGLLQGAPDIIRKPFFLLVSCVAIVFIFSLYRRLAPTQRALKWGLPLILGGAIGNLVDRIRYSWVVDFIDVHLVHNGRAYHWPTFNIADIAICVGVGLMTIDILTSSRPKANAGISKAPISDPPADAGTAP